jgi:RNA polymerase sigma-70 factor (ECF subfamily)
VREVNDNPDAWIFGIARNVVADYYRRQYRQPEVELNDGIAALPEQGPVEQVLNNEQRDHLVEAVSSLRDEYRDVILLRFIEELSIKDVAEILDKTPGSVKGLQHRALRALSAIMRGLSGQDIVGKHSGGHLRQI